MIHSLKGNKDQLFDKMTVTKPDEDNSRKDNTIQTKSKVKPKLNIRIRKKKPFKLTPLNLVKNFTLNSIEKNNNNTWNLFIYLFNEYFNKTITKEQIIDKLITIYEKLDNDNILITEPPKKTENNFRLKIANNNFDKSAKLFFKTLNERKNKLYSLREIFRLTLRNIYVSKWENIIALDNENGFEKLSENMKTEDWKNFYLTEFEYYLLCREYKIPVIINGFINHHSKKLSQIYREKKLNNCDQYLFTTFNLRNINNNGLVSCSKRGNLYVNVDNKPFVYVISLSTYRINNFYRGISKSGKMSYDLTTIDMKRDDSKKITMGFLSLDNDSTNNIKLNLNNSYVKELLNKSLNLNNNKEYIDYIFNNEINSIYMQYEKFNFERKNRRQQNRK